MLWISHRRDETGLGDCEGHVNPQDFHSLRRHFETIGARGDAARTTLLAGPWVFPFRELHEATRQLQITDRQRLRLYMASTVSGLSRGPRRLSRHLWSFVQRNKGA